MNDDAKLAKEDEEEQVLLMVTIKEDELGANHMVS